MKKILCFFIMFVLLFSIAQAEETVWGGSLERPEFRGIQLGMLMPVVMVWEKDAGLDFELTYPEDIESLSELSPDDSRSIKYSCENTAVCGENVSLVYTFKYNSLVSAALQYAAQDANSAAAYFELLASEMSACYGEYQITANGEEWTELFPDESSDGTALADKIDSLSDENAIRYLWAEPITITSNVLETYAGLTVQKEGNRFIVEADVGIDSIFKNNLPGEYTDARYYGK